MKDIRIGRIRIGPEKPPFIIAEMSGNHNGSLKQALAIVDAAAQAGAQAIKLQTYTADTMTLDSRRRPFRVDSRNKLWEGETLYSLYKKAFTPWEWHATLFARARKRGLLAFSSPFDAASVDLLESLGAPAYKIASFENGDWPLLKKVAATGKPVIMSTGTAFLPEIRESVGVLRRAGCRELILLHCTSSYPAKAANSNLRSMAALAREFGCTVGLSDHTMGIGAAVAAVALGARVVEKHFTLDRAEGGVDAAFSADPAELAALVRETRTAFESLGRSTLDGRRPDLYNRRFRRSIYVCRDVVPGEVLTPLNVRVIRPAGGLEPKFYERVLGRRAKRRIAGGTALAWEHLR